MALFLKVLHVTVVHLFSFVVPAALLGWALTGLAVLVDGRRAAQPSDAVRDGGAIATTIGAAILAVVVAMLALWDRPLSLGTAVLMTTTTGLALVAWLDRQVGLWPVTHLVARAVAVVVALDVLPDAGRPLEFFPRWAERGALALAWLALVEAFAALDVRASDAPAGAAATSAAAIAAGVLCVGVSGPSPVAMGPAMPAAALFGACLGALVFTGRRSPARLGDAWAPAIGLLSGWLLLDLARGGAWAAAVILSLVLLSDRVGARLVAIVRGDAGRLDRGVVPPLPSLRLQALRAADLRDRRLVVLAVVAAAVLTRWSVVSGLCTAVVASGLYLARLSTRADLRRAARIESHGATD